MLSPNRSARSTWSNSPRTAAFRSWSDQRADDNEKESERKARLQGERNMRMIRQVGGDGKKTTKAEEQEG